MACDPFIDAVLNDNWSQEGEREKNFHVFEIQAVITLSKLKEKWPRGELNTEGRVIENAMLKHPMKRAHLHRSIEYPVKPEGCTCVFTSTMSESCPGGCGHEDM